ncbi:MULTISPECIES: hypothetical protein [unclassified Phenylobacterium]|jgi:hypothetical protein|uniref:hypothetical protein n=1 Tax=unclassified Phenylobacterium TaxID=2640670 RepID=UPI000A66B0A6|nr:MULTISPECIES: hypothetical protein [unclassified Phenylobacterium]
MTGSDKTLARKARQRFDRWLERILASYISDESKADRTRVEASIELGDLASFEPETFWWFIEYVEASSVPVEKLEGLGFDLFTLLRNYPDRYDKRIAGLVRRDERFRVLMGEIDPDRVAPDVWRQIEAALAGE